MIILLRTCWFWHLTKQWLRTFSPHSLFYVYTPHTSGFFSKLKCLGLCRLLAALQSFSLDVLQTEVLAPPHLCPTPWATTATADEAIFFVFLFVRCSHTGILLFPSFLSFFQCLFVFSIGCLVQIPCRLPLPKQKREETLQMFMGCRGSWLPTSTHRLYKWTVLTHFSLRFSPLVLKKEPLKFSNECYMTKNMLSCLTWPDMPTQPMKSPGKQRSVFWGHEQSNLLSLSHDTYHNLAGDKKIITGIHLATLSLHVRAKFRKAGKQTEQNRVKYLLLSLHEEINFIHLFPERSGSMKTLSERVETWCSSPKE